MKMWRENTGFFSFRGVESETYDTATVVHNASMRSRIIGRQINGGTQWIIFETTQHINFGMPTGILESVVWD